MHYSEIAQATLLLSCYFNKNEQHSAQPLTSSEYAHLAVWLHQNKLTPASLLTDAADILNLWQANQQSNPAITKARLQNLLARGASMGFALESWSKQGIQVITRSCTNYPQKIHKKFGNNRPAIFFAMGNLALLNKPAKGLLGSRTMDATDAAFTTTLAQQFVSQGYGVVSGGTKGIEETAMLAALEAGGEVIGVLADSLLRSSTGKAYRAALRNNQLLLISPFSPESSFNINKSMARNKYLYALSEKVVIVKSELKGITWTGATENLKHNWASLWIANNAHQGNQALIKLGGQSLLEVATATDKTSP